MAIGQEETVLSKALLGDAPKRCCLIIVPAVPVVGPLRSRCHGVADASCLFFGDTGGNVEKASEPKPGFLLQTQAQACAIGSLPGLSKDVVGRLSGDAIAHLVDQGSNALLQACEDPLRDKGRVPEVDDGFDGG